MQIASTRVVSIMSVLVACLMSNRESSRAVPSGDQRLPFLEVPRVQSPWLRFFNHGTIAIVRIELEPEFWHRAAVPPQPGLAYAELIPIKEPSVYVYVHRRTHGGARRGRCVHDYFSHYHYAPAHM